MISALAYLICICALAPLQIKKLLSSGINAELAGQYHQEDQDLAQTRAVFEV